MNHAPANPAASARVRRTAGSLLIAVPTAFMGFFTALQWRFDYPDILRKPAADVLTRFSQHQDSLLPLWYGMLASALLFIPMSLAVASMCGHSRSRNQWLITFGILAGLVQTVGLARWVFAVPILAGRYVDTASPQERYAIAAIFDTLNALLGVGIGEQLGYIFTAAWTVVFTTIIRSTRPITAAIGVISAAAIAMGLLEAGGVAWAGTINALGYTVWSLWLVWIGMLTLADRLRGLSGSHQDS